MKLKKSFLAFLILLISASSLLFAAEKSVSVATKGGSGKAAVISPAALLEKDGITFARITWSSRSYDYIISDGKKYLNENPGGNSTFTFPLPLAKNKKGSEYGSGEPFSIKIKADTLAMGTPHEIDYELCFGGVLDFVAESAAEKKSSAVPLASSGGIGFDSLEKCGSLNLSYAEEFSVDFYRIKKAKNAEAGGNDGGSGEIYSLVKIKNSENFLLAPLESPSGISGKSAEIKNLPKNTFLLGKPIGKTYLVSTSAMDFIVRLGVLDKIRFSGARENGWLIPEARSAMEAGKILYAGKYSAPDYELLLSRGCDLAIENTMICHSPAVKEKLEELGIPVVVERSGYEKNPLGRLEWVKFYGILFGKLSEAEKYFDGEAERISGALSREKNRSAKKVAFFFVSSSGSVSARNSGDYISRMIEMAGGEYVPSANSASSDSKGSVRSTVSMQFESFYASASGADIIIYDRSIDKNLRTLSQLKKKNPLFSDFKAVKSGDVYCTKDDFFQRTTGTADFIIDLEKIAGKGKNAENLVFLERMR